MTGINSSVNITPYVYTDRFVNKRFAENIVERYEALSERYDVDGVKNIIILSNSDSDKLKDFEEIDDKDIKLLSDYVSGEAKESYGFYSKQTGTFVFIERNHRVKDEDLEGSIEEQGADTLTHEFGHLFGNEKSKNEEFREAYLRDLSAIEAQLEQNPEATVGDSDMTYREAVEYFAHYMDGVDFSDGIDEKDITDRGAKENYAEAFSVVNDTEDNPSNAIFVNLFENSVEHVALDCLV